VKPTPVWPETGPTGVAELPAGHPPDPRHLALELHHRIRAGGGLLAGVPVARLLRPECGVEMGVAVVVHGARTFVLRALGPTVLGRPPGPGWVGGLGPAARRLADASRALGAPRSPMAVLWFGGAPLRKARFDGQWLPPFADRPAARPPDGMTVRATGPGWVVVEKPADVLSVPGKGGADCVERALARRGPWGFVKMAHRLDMATSGLMVAATSPEALAHLHRQFRERRVEKRYEALLCQTLAGDHHSVRLFSRLDPAERPRQVADPVHGRSGHTDFEVLERTGARTRVAARPRTGRTHQIRLHAAHPLGLAAPISGDRLYGDGRGEGRLLLHATDLAFEDPQTGWPVHIHSPCPF
jgi:tRNA pseudouridine32 synthase / 23S rRNA pseudouridine746 synthase